MNKEQTLLLVINDLKNKLADAELRASDYLAQSTVYMQRVNELEYIQHIIDATPKLAELFAKTIEKMKEEENAA